LRVFGRIRLRPLRLNLDHICLRRGLADDTQG
jgi:hypothetical protein